MNLWFKIISNHLIDSSTNASMDSDRCLALVLLFFKIMYCVSSVEVHLLLVEGLGMLNLANAEKEFLSLLDRVESRSVAEFLDWINESFVVAGIKKDCLLDNEYDGQCSAISRVESTALLKQIAIEIRSEVPMNGLMNTEVIEWPKNGLDSDCDRNTTVHVDAFLYDDDDVDGLVDVGSLHRNYCTNCGSQEIKPLTFISHSLSQEQLCYIFTTMVPLNKGMKGRLIVDVGSRLGAVLYAVHIYGNGEIFAVGIEINKEFCDLQNKVIVSHAMSNSIKVINDDIRRQQAIVLSADVIVLNNVFTFFLPHADQIECWEFLHKWIRPGAVIVSNPSLVTITEHLSLSFQISDWLDKIDTRKLAARFAGTDEELFEDCEKITLYSVKPPIVNPLTN